MTRAELHAHVFMDGKDYKKCVEKNRISPDEAHIRSVFSVYQKSGISFIREGGDHFGVCLKAKELACEYGITYIIPAFAIYKEGNYGKVAGKSYASIKDYISLIEQAKAEGADFIKLMLSGILDFDRFGVVSKTDYRADEMKEMVRIAHSEGFSVMAHVNGRENILNAVAAGADSVEHGYYIDGEGLCALKESGCVWIPTAVTSSNLAGTDRFNEESVLKIASLHKENIRKGSEAGVNIGCGSDAGAFGVLHAKGAMQEYELLCSVMGEGSDKRLLEAENIIREKFSKRR